MLSRRNKLSRRDFEYIRLHGRRVRSEFFSCIYTPCSIDEITQFSVVIPKKVLRFAVRRNMIKRRVYHVLGEYMPTNICVRGIFFAQKGIECARFQDIQKDIKILLSRVKRIENESHS